MASVAQPKSQEINGNTDFKQNLRWFLAHESAHFWQVDLGEDTARWHSEGGADFIAFTAMLALGHMSQNEGNTAFTALLEPAIEGLKKTSLVEAHLNGAPELNYKAAPLVMLAADSAVDLDIFEIEISLSQVDPDQHQTNPMQAFIDVLRQAGASPTACPAIEAFITTDQPFPRTALIDLFKATNVDYQIEDNRIMISL